MRLETIVKLRDAFTLASDALQEELESQAPKATISDSIPDMGLIPWTEKIGPKGAFQLSEDKENPHFKALAAYLVTHDGKAQVSGYFVWKFENGSIGRKSARKA